MTEAETGLTQRRAKDRQGEAGATGSWETGLECTHFRAPRGDRPCRQPYVGLRPPER